MDSFTRCWKKPDTPRATLAILATLLVACLMVGCARPAMDAGPSISVITLKPNASAGEGGATLNLSHSLSAQVLDALQHGVTVTFQWQLQLREPRSLLWDSLLWDRTGVRQVSYRSLSRRFTLTQPASGQATSFRDLPTLLSALDAVHIDGVPEPAQTDNGYYQVRARLVISRLPPALRLSSYLSDQWRMDSGWVRVESFSP